MRQAAGVLRRRRKEKRPAWSYPFEEGRCPSYVMPTNADDPRCELCGGMWHEDAPERHGQLTLFPIPGWPDPSRLPPWEEEDAPT